jgi:hypothetical protein
MPTVAELSLDEEFAPLEENAALKGWKLGRRGACEFVLGILARDDSWFWLLCRCDRYPAMPPAWHWLNPETMEYDRPQDTPKGGGFFHGNGVICAPWNRLAYKSEDPRGPHNDWTIGNWRAEPKTGACTTLSAMALRVATELRASTYEGRLG